MPQPMPSLLGRGVARLFDSYLSDQSITPDQRRLAAAGDVEGFWRSRDSKGDAVARSALKSLHPKSNPWDSLFGGAEMNGALEAYSRVYAKRPADLDAIRRDLMRAHVAAIDADRTGLRGNLSPAQIAEYHHRTFAQHGLPSTAFGGTPFSGSLADVALTYPLWAWGTDPR